MNRDEPVRVEVWRDCDLLPTDYRVAETGPTLTMDTGLLKCAEVYPGARVSSATGALDVAWACTESDVVAAHAPGFGVRVDRHVECRSNVVGDWFILCTPDGDVPYQVAPFGFQMRSPAAWERRKAGVWPDAGTQYLVARQEIPKELR